MNKQTVLGAMTVLFFIILVMVDLFFGTLPFLHIPPDFSETQFSEAYWQTENCKSDYANRSHERSE